MNHQTATLTLLTILTLFATVGFFTVLGKISDALVRFSRMIYARIRPQGPHIIPVVLMMTLMTTHAFAQVNLGGGGGGGDILGPIIVQIIGYVLVGLIELAIFYMAINMFHGHIVQSMGLTAFACIILVKFQTIAQLFTSAIGG